MDCFTSTDEFFDDLKNPEKLKIAVVLPVYNTAPYLCECLESLICQIHANFVIYAVDDGSCDGSGTILDEYASLDDRFRVFHTRNNGVSSARNFALEQIEKNGEAHLVAFCDSDDVVNPNFLQLYASAAAKFRVQFVTIGYQSFDKNGFINRSVENHSPILLDKEKVLGFCLGIQPESKKSSARANFLNNIAFCSWLIRGIRFNPERNIGEDLEFRFLALQRMRRGVALSDVGYNYRIRKSSLSSDVSLLFLFLDLELYISWLKFGGGRSCEFSKGVLRLACGKFKQALIWANDNNELNSSWKEFAKYYAQLFPGIIVPSFWGTVFILFRFGPRVMSSYLNFKRRKARSLQSKRDEKMLSAFD